MWPNFCTRNSAGEWGSSNWEKDEMRTLYTEIYEITNNRERKARDQVLIVSPGQE